MKAHMNWIATSIATSVVSIGCIATLSHGQTTIVGTPPLQENSFSSGSLFPNAGVPLVFQQYIDGTQIPAGSQPRLLTGVTFRLAWGNLWRPQNWTSTQGTWPLAPVNFANYRINIGTATASVSNANDSNSIPFSNLPLQSTNPTFNTMIQPGTDVQVYNGTLTIPANSFRFSPDVNGIHEWGDFFIPFSTPFTFSPNQDIIVTIRHSGGDAPFETLARFASRPSGRNFVDAWGNFSAGQFAATPTFPDGVDAIYMAFQTTPVPEPVTLGVMLGAGAMLLKRRSR
jgi:hypothetical protein